MPKAAQNRLVWSAGKANYYLQGSDSAAPLPILLENGESWLAWLENCPSFAFEGRAGSLNLLKEERSGEGYWYAYRRQGRKTLKRYAGRSAKLTLERLEELARQLDPDAVPLSTDDATDPGVPQKPVITANQSPLLNSKLSLPRLHNDVIERERLLTLLDVTLEHRLTLVSAPAGFGKTTLVRQWLERRCGTAGFPPAGWLSLDLADNDPGRFWRYFIAACRSFSPNFGQTAWHILEAQTQLSFEPASWEPFLITLLNELASLPGGALIVLEDFHNVNQAVLYQTLEFLLDHLPGRVHLLLISRTLPLLPLARWRALNELGEVDGSVLHFTPGETRAFLERSLSQSITLELATRLDQKLAGWAAALRLVVLAWRNQPAEFGVYLENFAVAGQRTLLEYFVNEVLNAQPPLLQDFLLRTSLLERLNPALCQVVTGREDSATLLQTLGRSNFFLELTDEAGQWYHYPPVFGEVMQHEARRRLGATVLAEVWERAGRWYEEQGMLRQAIEIALAAGAVERAAELIEQFIVRQYSGGKQAMEMHNSRRWIERLPVTTLDKHPNIRLQYALILLFIAMTEQSSPTLQNKILESLTIAEAGFVAEGNRAKLGEVKIFWALLSRHHGDLAEAVNYATQALEMLPLEEYAWRSWSLGILGMDAFMAGNFAEAKTRYLEAQALGELEGGNRTHLRANAGMLSGVYGAVGELHQAHFYVKQVLEEARIEGDLDDVSHALVGMAYLNYEWDQLETARAQAQEAFEIARHFGDPEIQIEAEASLVLARLDQAEGHSEAALEGVNTLLTRLQPQLSPLFARLHRQARLVWARLHLAQRDLALVQQWQAGLADTTDTGPIPLVEREQEEITIARFWLVADDPARAQMLLEPVLNAALTAGRRRSGLAMQLLLAQVYNAQGRTSEALELVRAVLTFAYTQGYRRLFLDEGPVMATLLRQLAPAVAQEKSLRTYLQTLLAAFDAENQPARPDDQSSSPVVSLIEPLSRQEKRVLRLLVAGQTNPQIARELVVSVNTVRSQVQSIYRKLDVNNRQAAAEVARRLRLHQA